MFPSNPSVYPEFVADQLLTAHDLNELFGYLDEQGRMTRTNLIGIGIVCGLQVQVNATQTQITITKGVGVTSLGYLVSVPTTTYSKYILYDSKVKEKTYDRFVNDGPPKSNKFNVWELAQASVYPEALDITPDFLEDKIVMIFVELLEVGNKNCDPNSCDDKGMHTEVRFVPMLVGQEDALTLIGSMGSTITADTFTGLPEIRMRRFDVPNTNPVTSEDIFNAYKSILNTTFLSATENSLTQAYNAFSVFITADFPANPFAGLAADFAFINNGTITVEQLKHIQYHYDLFSDFLLAYKEFRKTGMAIMSACCPDAGLFPRHLLLGEAIPLPGNVKSSFRHYFIYSPLFEQKSLLNELKSLFRKMVLLMEKFLVPPVNSGSPSSKTDPYIRITPSLLEDVGLSKKAIPYYYNPVSGTIQLYKFWDFEKTAQGRPQFNLSYNANQYNVADDFILNPLNYDLEPYNFLRIEGIIGKPYAHVLKNIKYQIGINRLPFDIIALNTDNVKLSGGIKLANPITAEALNSGTFTGGNFTAANMAAGPMSSLGTSSFATSAISADFSSAIRDLGIRDSMEAMCHFQDLEAMYATMKNEMLCMLCKELKYYYDLRYNFNTKPNTGAGAATTDVPSVVGLFNTCSPGYIVKQGTFGFLIEKVYKVVGNEGNITIQAIADALDIENILTMDMNGDGLPDINSPALATLVGFITNLFAVPIYIIRLANTFTSSLSTFDPEKYCALHQLLVQNANSLKFVFNMVTAADKQALRAETTNVFNSDVNVNTAPVDANTLSGSGTINRSFLSSMAVSQSNMGRMLLLVLLLEDFFDHLDTLIYNCKCSAFKALKVEYLRRLLYLERLRQFGYFTKLHPGIQHKAGVPMGGTFIIVYHSRGARGTTTGVFGITGFVRDLAGAAMVGAVVLVRGTTAGAITDANGQFKFTVNELPVTVTVLINGIEAKQVIVNSQGPIIIVIGTDDNDDTANESLADSITEGTVIADFYLPYRCCSDCPPIQYIINERTLPAPTDQLTVNAGPDQEIRLPDDKVTVNGSATAAAGNTITSFLWEQSGGPAGEPAEINKPDNSQADISKLREGTYKFELTVKDDKGNIERDHLIVKVNPAIEVGQPPVANAGEDVTIVLGTAPVTLDGTGSSDPAGGILDYNWELENPSTAPSIPDIISNRLDKTGVTITAPGVYEFKLTVKNRFGLTNSDTVKVTVEAPPNQPPVANAGGNTSVILPGTAVLNGSLSKDPEGGAIEYAWKFESGPATTAVIDKPTFAVTKVSNLVAGTYKFKLTVKDDKGATAEDIATITVTNREQTVKRCSDFPKIIDLFNGFPGVDQNNFGRFREFFRPYDTEIVPLFEKFGPGGINITGLSVDKQIDFFGTLVLTVRNAAGANINVSLVDALQKWLQELSDLVVVRANDTAAVAANKNLFRIQVMALYRILLQLATYIICIQKEDFNTARVPMDAVMKMVQAHIDEWEANILQFREKEIDMIGFIGDDLKAEEQRVNSNGEAGIKTKYVAMLKKIIQVIDSIP